MTPMLIILEITLGLAAVLLLVMAVSDVKKRIISNQLSLALFAVAAIFISAAALGGYLSVDDFLVHLFAYIAAFALCFMMFTFGVMGGGDAKVIPSVVMITGAGYLAAFLIVMALAGGAMALVMLVRRFAFSSATVSPRLAGDHVSDHVAEHSVDQEADSDYLESRDSANHLKIPYGVAIFFGAVPVFVKISQMMTAGGYYAQ